MRDYIQLAQSAGSTATTTRGARQWLTRNRSELKALYAPAPPIKMSERVRVLAALKTRAECGIETAALMRSTRKRVNAIAAMVRGIQYAICHAEKGCDARCIYLRAAMAELSRCVEFRDSRFITGGGVAKSYDYAYSTSCCEVQYDSGYIRIRIWRDHSRRGIMRQTILSIPRRVLDGVGFSGLLPGEACTITAGGVTRRYAMDGSFAGVLVPMPEDLRREYGQWEHGRTVAECRAEIEIKRAAKAARAREIAQTERERMRATRRASLIAKLCHGAMVTAADVRRVGACQAGISAWCAARGIDPRGTLSLPALAADRTAARYALMIARGIRRGV